MRIRPGSEVEHGDGHRKADGVRRLAESARGVGFGYERRFTGSLKECRDIERFEEFAVTVREEFYRRRRHGGIVAATLRIPKGTTCPVTRLQNPP